VINNVAGNMMKSMKSWFYCFVGIK